MSTFYREGGGIRMRKLLIADGIEESRQALEGLLRERCEVRTCADGETAMALLRDFAPDILVLDLMLPKTDGLSLLQQLHKMDLRPMVLVQTSLNSPYVMEKLQRLEVDYVMQKPCKMQALESRVMDFLAQLQQSLPQLPAGDAFVANVLIRFGFSPKLDGYSHLMEAIPRYAKDPSQAIIKELYAAVGEVRRKDASQVERSIRSAIEKAWQDGNQALWRQYFCCAPNGAVIRPSNGAFIARMAQLLTDGVGKIAL